MEKVVLVKCSDYSHTKEALQKAVDLLGGIQKFVKKGQTVLIKPNICDPIPPEKAATTHPLLVKAVIEIVRQAGASPIVGELAAGSTPDRTKEAFRVSGIEKVCKETKTPLIDFQQGDFIPKDIPNYKVLEKTDFAEAVLEANAIINLPKLKTHGLTYLTGAVKNFFGCIHPEEREYIHQFEREEFSQAVVDVYSFLRHKIVLNIMDAILVMEGNEGPSYGTAKKVGLLLASADAVALDSVAARLVKHNPLAIPTTKLASERKLGTANAAQITLVGDKLQQLESFEQHSNYKNRFESLQLQPRITDRCQKCGSCSSSCPAKAISLVKGKYSINESICTKCYCCLEVCIYAAIELKKPALSADLIRLGSSCNQACVFCTVGKDKTKNLTTAEAKKQIRFLAENGCGKIALTGGEPTVRKDLAELVRYAKENGLQIELQTNGALLSDKKYADKLIKAGVLHFFIPLHSHKEEISNMLTNSKDFKKTVAGIKNVMAKASIAISHVITSKNYQDLAKFVAFVAKEFGSKIIIYFGFVRPNGNALDNKWVVPKLTDTEFFLYSAFNKCRELNIEFSVEGIPLCYMQGYETNNDETKRLFGQNYFHLEGKEIREDTHKKHFLEDKSRSKSCDSCLLDAVCPKIWKEYSNIFGTEELFPVFDNIVLKKLSEKYG